MKVKGNIDKSIPYIIVISIILMNLLLCAGIISMFFVDKDTIIAGVIAFFGAIIGGAITLVGVVLSINHNEKLRIKDDLPDKINHIENALNTLGKIIENDLVFESGTKKFITLTNLFNIECSSDFDRFTGTVPKELKKDFIYIDSEAYRMYLKFKSNVQLLGMNLLNNAELKLHDFRDETIGNDNTDFMDKTNIVIMQEDVKFIEKRMELNRFYLKQNREFAFALHMIYFDIHTQLTLKHDQLIEELDY